MTREVPTSIPNLPAGGFAYNLFDRRAFDQNTTVTDVRSSTSLWVNPTERRTRIPCGIIRQTEDGNSQEEFPEEFLSN